MNGKQSVLKQHLSNKFYFIKRGDKRKYTHLLLDGGTIFIPPADRNEFLRFYAARLEVNDDKLFMIENKTEYFKLFFDLDILNALALPEDTLRNIIIIIQKSIHEQLGGKFTPHESRVIVCTAKNKTIDRGGSVWVKTGVHLHWPELVVNKKIALVIRNVCLDALNKSGGSRPEINPWEDVIDRCVFEDNGIRMIGSRNIKNCQHCKSRKIDTKTCTVCNGTGKIDEGRSYFPSMVIDGKGVNLQKQLTELNSDKYKMILEVSIQTDYTELPKEINIPEKFMDISKKLQKGKKGQPTTQKKNLFNIGGIDDNCSMNSQEVTLDDNKMKKLVKFVKAVMPNVYKEIDITHIKRINSDDYVAYILYTNSRFCMNLNNNHNSNGIYFLIDKNYIYQKCWCRCNTLVGRKFGFCKDYKSEGRLLDNSIQNMLFPDEKDKRKTTMYIPPLCSIKSNNKQDKVRYEKSLNQATDQLLSKLINKKAYEDEVVGKSLKMKLK